MSKTPSLYAEASVAGSEGSGNSARRDLWRGWRVIASTTLPAQWFGTGKKERACITRNMIFYMIGLFKTATYVNKYFSFAYSEKIRMWNSSKIPMIFIICNLLVLVNCQNATQPGNNFHGPWVEFNDGSISLYCRPAGYSTRPSPDSSAAFAILKEQHDWVKKLNDSLHINFDKPFDLYLFKGLSGFPKCF